MVHPEGCITPGRGAARSKVGRTTCCGRNVAIAFTMPLMLISVAWLVWRDHSDN
jgi:hypothetical protein